MPTTPTRCPCGNQRNLPPLKLCSECFNRIRVEPVTAIVDGEIRRAVVVHPVHARFPGLAPVIR